MIYGVYFWGIYQYQIHQNENEHFNIFAILRLCCHGNHVWNIRNVRVHIWQYVVVLTDFIDMISLKVKFWFSKSYQRMGVFVCVFFKYIELSISSFLKKKLIYLPFSWRFKLTNQNFVNVVQWYTVLMVMLCHLGFFNIRVLGEYDCSSVIL